MKLGSGREFHGRGQVVAAPGKVFWHWWDVVVAAHLQHGAHARVRMHQHVTVH